MSRKILVVNVDSASFHKFAPILERADFEVDRFPRAKSAVDLLSVVPFDVLIVRYPLPDMPLQNFLDFVRSAECPSMRSPLLLLASSEMLREAEIFVGKGASRVVSAEDVPESLQGAVSDLLEVAPRLSVRFTASLEAQLENGTSSLTCQSENVSATGMLVRTERRFPIGCRVSFQLVGDEAEEPICGEACVVRHTSVGRESVSGFALRFDRFDGDGRDRLLAYLEQQQGRGSWSRQ